MAAAVQPADRSEQVITSQRKENIHEIFIPKDTLDQPCDVVFMSKMAKNSKVIVEFSQRPVLSFTRCQKFDTFDQNG